MNAAIAKLLIQIAAALCLVLLVGGVITQTGPGQVARDSAAARFGNADSAVVSPCAEDFHVGDLWFNKVAESDASGYCMPSKVIFPILIAHSIFSRGHERSD